MRTVDILREHILEGQIRAGTFLSQTELAARFGVSRIPVRDALQQLAAERLVVVVPGKGAQVVLFNDIELDEIFELRQLLEGDLLRRAASQAQESHYATLQYARARSRLEAGRPGWPESDWNFHFALYAPAQRRRQTELVKELRQACLLHAAQYEKLAENTPDWLDHHDEIFEAFVTKNIEQAVAHLHKHLRAAHQHLITLRGAV